MAKKQQKFEIACEVTTIISRTIEAPSLAEAKRRMRDLPPPTNEAVMEEWNQQEKWSVVAKVDRRRTRFPAPDLTVDDFDEMEGLPWWLDPDEEDEDGEG